jgi:hypothetical protein
VLMEYVFVQINILEHFVGLLDNPCYNPICRNGGFCLPDYNSTSVSFTCTCPNLYTGQYCETLINVPQTAMTAYCLSTCSNGGVCLNGMCMCTSQYIGPSCQYSKTKRNKIK